MSKIRAIIPCCGFGTRMNMPKDKSKELLPDLKGNPLIAWHLNLYKKYDLEPLIITRPEKKDLIAYARSRKIECVQMEPGKEWPHTVYNSQPYWNEKNILMLPDTRFEPHNVIEQIKRSLDFGFAITFAVHNVDDVTKWGYVGKNIFCEKPRHSVRGTAWGLIGFKNFAGNLLFHKMQTSGLFHEHIFDTNFVFLNNFVDITRTGKIEY